MLADQNTAVLDQLVCSLFLCCLIIPGSCEGYIHGSSRAYGTRAQEEGCVTGDNLCIGKCSDVTNLSLLCGNIAIVNHLIQLHACGDTCQVTSVIDGSECVVEIVQILCMRLGSGCVAELYLRILLGCLDHVILMSEAVCEDEVAACVRQLACCLVALLTLRNIGLGHVLDAQLLASLFCGVHEVQVICGILIVQEDKTYLDVCQGSLSLCCGGLCVCLCIRRSLVRRSAAACQHADGHSQYSNETKYSLFHNVPPICFPIIWMLSLSLSVNFQHVKV